MVRWLVKLARAAWPTPRADRVAAEVSPEPEAPAEPTSHPRTLPVDDDDVARLVLQVGHASVVQSVSVSPDGRRLVTGALDGTLRLWDLPGGLQLRTLVGGGRPTAAEDTVLEGWVKGQFAPRGNRVLFWDNDRFGVIDLDDLGRSYQVGQPGRLDFLSFVDEGRKIFAGDGASHGHVGDNHIRLALFDAAEGRRLADYAVPVPQPVSGFSFAVCRVTPDGTTALVGLEREAEDPIAFRAWDLAADAPAGDYTGPNGVRDLAVSPSGQRYLAVGADNRAYVWERGTAAPRLVHGAEGGARPAVGDTVVQGARFLDDDDAVVLTLKTIDSVADYDHERVASGPGALARWDLRTDRLTHDAPHAAVRLGEVPVLDVADGSLVSVCDGNRIDVWDLARWAPVRTLKGNSPDSSRRMEDLTVDDAGTMALISYQDGKRLLVNLQRGDVIRQLRDDDYRHAHLSPHGRYLAIGARIEQAGSGDVVLTGDWRYAYGFHGDGENVLVRTGDEQVILVETATGAVVAALAVPPIDPDEVAHLPAGAGPGDNEPVVAEEAALSPDRRFLATAGGRHGPDYANDMAVRVWDFGTGELIAKLERDPEGAWVDSLAFSGDGSLLLVGSAQPELWHTADWTRRHVLGARPDEDDDDVPYDADAPYYRAATSARLVNDDSQVLTTHENGKVRLWSVASGEETVAMHDRHAGRATAAVWLGQRGVVLSVGFDAVVRAFDGNDGRRLLHYLPRGGDDWLVVDAQGRFDAGGEVGDAVVWVHRDRAYALDELRADFLEPELLAKHLGSHAGPLRDVSAPFPRPG